MKQKILFNQSMLFLIIGVIVFLNYSAYAIDWYEKYNTKWPNGINPSYTLPWSETYILRSYISMYRASKARGEPQAEQQKWIDRLVEHCDYVVNSTKMEKEGKSYLVYAGHGFTPLSRFVKIIFKDSALYLKYKDKANNYLHYIESKIVPYWRNRTGNLAWWFTPFNWYLSYGSLLMNLHQITRLPNYLPPNYITPDTTLKKYYFKTVTDIANNYFNDFANWEYTPNWNNDPYPQKKGLCYCPNSDAYIWRYFDYIGSLNFMGYVGEAEYQGVENANQLKLNKWYNIIIDFKNDTLTMRVFANDGTTLIMENSTPWKMTGTEANLIIGKRVDSDQFFKGVIDEMKIEKNGKLVANWKMEGNAIDSSGHNHNGIIHGNPTTVEGKVGKAFKFDDGDYIVVPHNKDLDSFTRIELWVKFLEFNSARYFIFGKGDHFQYGPGGYHLFFSCLKRPEDVGHANLDIEFLVKATHDPVFSSAYTPKMLKRFTNTFTKIVWTNSDIDNPTFKSHLHPGDYGNPNFDEHTLRWLWLYEFDPKIGQIISNWYANHPNDQSLSEAVANLACWQEGLFIDDYETTPVKKVRAKSTLSLQVFPNPINTEANISYRLNEPSFVTLSIYNINGILINTLVNKLMDGAGYYSTIWNVNDLYGKKITDGIYYIKLQAGVFSSIRKIIILK